MPTVPYPIDYIWFVALLALLASISFLTRPRTVIVFLCLAGLLGLLDQNRWQPWFYQYFFMLAALGSLTWRKADAANNQAPLNVCRLIVTCIYLWSGIQKLNVTFVRNTWPEMVSFLPSAWQIQVGKIPSFLILIIPLLEIFIGIGLLSSRFRNKAVIAATAMHAGILTLLVVSRENIVVWPWNVAMILFVWLVFWRDKKTTARTVLFGRNAIHILVLFLFGVLPVFSFAGLWDSYLSAALYSGNTHQAVIYVSEPTARLSQSVHPHIWQKTEPYFLDINRWAYDELHVPVYPEPRVYRCVAKKICQDGWAASDIRLRVNGKPDPLTGQRSREYYDCEQLL